MPSKYVDLTSIIQVIGCTFNNPNLLDYGDKYNIIEDDFPDQFHKIIFGAIHNLYNAGSKKIKINNVVDYLAARPKSDSIFQKQKGEEWLLKASESATASTFDYYYNRMKKMTLLRAYNSYGVDVSEIYDPDNILDVKKKQLQEEQLDNLSLGEIADKIEKKIDEIRYSYVDNMDGEAFQAGDGIFNLIADLKQRPEVGVPLYGSLINTVTRGARLKKFYLRSAPTGVGKSRTMVADACYIGCDKMYNSVLGMWNSTGMAQPVLYITTEQELNEVQTMMLAFLADVNEEHILNSLYENDEENRVLMAADILTKSPIFIETLPDFSLQDIEDTIKKNIREHQLNYVFNP